MKLTSWLMGLVLCCSLSAEAAIEVKTAVDHKATLKGMIKQLTSFEARFKQNVIDVDGKPLMEGEGKVYLFHPSLIRWHAITPDENLMVADGNTLWIYNIDLEQVTATSAKDAIDSTAFALLASSDELLWQKYQVSKNKDAFVISPIEPAGQVKRLILNFNDKQFSRLTIEDISGQKSEFNFVDTLANGKIDPSLFKFTLPEGVDLDDQRQ